VCLIYRHAFFFVNKETNKEINVILILHNFYKIACIL